MDAIRTTNLAKTFNGVKAVNELCINVPAGSVYGFLGPNGAGKTTTLKMLTGMLKPDQGEIYLNGEKLSFGQYEQYRHIGFLPDVPEYYNYMNAKEFLQLCGRLFNIPNTVLDKRIKELLELTGIETNKKIKGYSRGMKQRLGIAQALINEPSIVFLDEPTSALDPLGRMDILNLISSLKEKATVFFSTHILSDVERICDRIAILDHGTMIVEDTIEGIKSKHFKNKVLLRTNENAVAKEIFSKQIWVKGMEEAEHLILEVRDLEKAKREIPGLLSHNQLQLEEFKVLEPTLEDIFIEAVNA